MSLKPPDIHALHEVSSPSLSPDGSALVYVQTCTDQDKKTSPSQLMLCQVGWDKAQPFTAGPKDSAPQYAPDERTIGFLRPASDGGKSQLWLISTAAGEAQQLTNLPGGVREFAWAPDSTQLVLVSRVDPYVNAATDAPQTQVVRRIRYRDDGDGWRGDAFSQLFVVDIDGAVRQLTDAEGDHLAPVWSPDGDRIACISDAVADRDVSKHSEVRVVSVDSGAVESWAPDLWRANSLVWSPDGQRLAAVGSHDPHVWDARQSWLYVLEAGGACRMVAGQTHTVVHPLPQHCWTADDHLIYIADRAGQSFLCRTPATGGDQEIISSGAKTFSSLALDAQNKRAAVVAATTNIPGDIYLVDLETSAAQYLTSINEEFLQTHPAAPVEKFAFEHNGCTIEARLLFPPNFDAAQKYPLVLDIHGGPNGRFSDSYDVAQQVLGGAGYLVLAANPRGSSSYGPEFLKAVMGDWGGEDFLDLMAAVDAACQRPYVDAQRLGVHGYSYGGYMSSWIIGRDYRFKAAVIGAPCTNLHSMYGTSDIGVSFGENQWKGNSFERVEALVERSPLTYVAAVQTPALLLHGEVDYRCPIEQSEQFFVALKRQDKTVEFVRFPGGAHNFRKTGHPQLRQEYYQRMIDWFERFFAAPPP